MKDKICTYGPKHARELLEESINIENKTKFKTWKTNLILPLFKPKKRQMDLLNGNEKTWKTNLILPLFKQQKREMDLLNGNPNRNFYISIFPCCVMKDEICMGQNMLVNYWKSP